MKTTTRSAAPAPRGHSALFIASLLATAFLWTTGTHDALAQSNKDKKKQEELKPPTPPDTNIPGTHYWGIGAVILGTGLIVGVNLIPSKRGHQD